MVKFRYILSILILSLLTMNLMSADRRILSKNKQKISDFKYKKQRKNRSSKIDSLVLDANFSLNRGDSFRSIKLYEYIRKKNKSIFYSKKVYGKYLLALSRMGGIGFVKSECKTKITLSVEKQNNRHYQCARELYTLGSYQSSLSYLAKIKSKTDSTQLTLLRSSNYLALKNPKKCISNLSNQVVATKFLDLKSITLGRCEMLRRNFRKAVSYYKNVSSDSQHYLDALYEMSWAQFKGRNIGEAKGTIDVLLSSYQDFSDDRAEISQKEYFKLRYLRAYLGLVQQGASDVTGEMNHALTDLEEAKIRTKLSPADLKNIVSVISDAKLSWKELARKSQNFKELVSFLENWGGSYRNQKLIKDLKYHLALSFEMKRLKIFSNQNYKLKISRLHKLHREFVSKELEAAYSATREAMKGFELRIQLAKYKKNILQETQGIRNLEQAKEIYSNKEDYLGDLVGGIE